MTAAPDPAEMPKGMLARARWAAKNTPEKRNRAVDLYRAIAITFVVLGHWLLVAPVIRNGEIELSILLAEQTWTQYATWLFQVMPVFFFVGGYSNSLSWASARRDPERKRAWAATRLTRLLKPTVPLVVIWAIAAFIAGRAGVSPDLINAASKASLVPVWFLAVYILITVAVPVTAAIWDRIGIWSVALLVACAIAVDTLAFTADMGWLRWSNYAFVWLAVHQLGYWWHTSDYPKTWALAFVVLGVATVYTLVGPLGYPVSMVSVPGEEISNTRPPTVAMLAVGSVQIGVILLLEGPASRWLKRVRPWSWVILYNQMIMSVYLWHITAMIAVIGLAVLSGGVGLSMEPGIGLWWALRPVWVLLFTAALIPFVGVFLRFEAASRAPGTTPPGPARALIGALVTCGGLIMIALSGIGAASAIGVNLIAVALVVVGVGIATWSLKAPSGAGNA
ncbi:MAG: acyltransferase [Paracoccaceae bacterium]|nr:acyltransferase [Paracoccaceae bacterium]